MVRVVRRIALLIIFLSMVSNFVLGGTNSWTTIGPYGGEITCLTIDPLSSSVIYAAVYPEGLYKSGNGGGDWQPAASGIQGQHINSICVNHQDSSVVYVSTNSGLFKSVDAGVAWNLVAFDGKQPGKIIIDSDSPQNLYVIVSENYSFEGFYKSVDAGGSFVKIIFPEEIDYIEDVALSVSNPSVLYAVSFNALLKSEDQGQSWAIVYSDADFLAAKIYVDPADSDVVYRIAPVFYPEACFVYKSVDGGRNWVLITNGWPSALAYSLAFVPGSPSSIVMPTSAGIYKSDNGGEDWFLLSPECNGMTSLFFDLQDPGTVFGINGEASFNFSTCHGLMKSVDGGSTWSDAAIGITAHWVRGFTIDPVNDGTFYSSVSNYYSTTGDTKGIYKTVDGGIHWENSYCSEFAYGAFHIDPTDTNTLWTSGYAARSGGGSGSLLRTRDRGTTWNEIGTNIVSNGKESGGCLQAEYVPPCSVAVDRNGILYVAGEFGVEKSADKGDTFAKLPFPEDLKPSYIAVDPSEHLKLYVYVYLSGLYKSLDGGQTWEIIFEMGSSVIRDFAIHPSSPEIIFMSTLDPETDDNFLQKSIDGGISWRNLNFIGEYISSVALDPLREDVVYISTSSWPIPEGFIFKSYDGGESWERLGAAFMESPPGEITVDPFKPNRIYANFDLQGIRAFDQVPVVTGISVLKDPFRLRIDGSGFQAGIKVFIGDEAVSWSDLVFKNGEKLILKGGKNLKRLFPKGTIVRLRLLNPDGGETTFNWKR